LEVFHSDEEPENFESQKEDMKIYLNKLNTRINSLVEALKVADNMMTKMDDENEISKPKSGFSSLLKSDDAKKNIKSLADVFKETLKNSNSKF